MPRLSHRGRRGNLQFPHMLPMIAVVGGLLLPLIIVWKSSLYDFRDYQVFAGWAECWLKDPKNIYLNCTPDHPANYPPVGMIATAGALAALKTLMGVDDYAQIANYFRFYLAFFESVNFLLLWQIARSLEIKHAVWISLLISALPSSWAGGALWGQIEGLSQFFLLACVLCLVFAIQSDPGRYSWRSTLCFGLGLLTLVAFLLTKQLAVFSLPAIVLLVLLAYAKMRASGTNLNGALVTAAVVVPAVMAFWILDRGLNVPPGYDGSGYLFVWLGGRSLYHTYISGNGFNIWMLLGRNMWSSAKVPFACVQLLQNQFCLTPFPTGIVLYVSYVVILTAFYSSLFWRPLLNSLLRDQVQTRCIIAILILYLAQINLGFNVFLSGTHERYLYHFFPFLMVAIAFFLEKRMFFSYRSVSFCIAVATVYGGFVYSIMRADDTHYTHQPLPAYISALANHEFVATIHLILLIYLFILSFRLLWSSIFGALPLRIQLWHFGARLVAEKID
jgi:hypothetical protein